MKNERRLAIASCLVFLAYANSVVASDNLNKAGNITVESQNYNDVTVKGDFVGNKLTVDGLTKIEGSANIDNSSIHEIVVRGPSHITDSEIVGDITLFGDALLRNTKTYSDRIVCDGNFASDSNTYRGKIFVHEGGRLYSDSDTFNGTVKVYGPVIAMNSFFYGGLIYDAQELRLQKTFVKGALINNYDSWFHTPVVILDNSRVSGNIIFSHKKGLVVVKGNASVRGFIRNADVEAYDKYIANNGGA